MGLSFTQEAKAKAFDEPESLFYHRNFGAWSASGNSTVSGATRTWTLSCSFGGEGTRTVTFKGTADRKTMSEGKTASIVVEPVATPTPAPTPTSTPEPTEAPTPTPTPEPEPTEDPTPTPTPEPDNDPTPTPEPEQVDDPTPTPEPAEEPTQEPEANGGEAAA